MVVPADVAGCAAAAPALEVYFLKKFPAVVVMLLDTEGSFSANVTRRLDEVGDPALGIPAEDADGMT